MLIVSKGALRDFNICTTVFENPHCGNSLVPFIKRTTLLEVTTLSNVIFSSGVNAVNTHKQRDIEIEAYQHVNISKQKAKETCGMPRFCMNFVANCVRMYE